MKKWLNVNRKVILLVSTCCLLLVVGFVSLTYSSTKSTLAAGSKKAAVSAMTLNTTSGPPGTHVFITGTGFTPGEQVQPVWNYTGPGPSVLEKSFYYFSPLAIADANGIALPSIFVPTYPQRDYTLAIVGLTSNTVETTVFHVTPDLETGVYIGNAGTTLRLSAWGFPANATSSLYWNWTANNPGQHISDTTTDRRGAFSGITFTIPVGTSNGVYTVAAVDANNQVESQTQFTVGTPLLNGSSKRTDWGNFGYNLQGTRTNGGETTLSTANVSTLALKWKNAFPVNYKVTGSPVIVNGIAYAGTIQGTLVAVSVTTGKTLWTFDVKGPIYGSPTVRDGIAYFGTSNYPWQGVIGNYAYALNATTGSLIWQNFLDLGADWVSPLVNNGTVYFPSALKEGTSGGFSAFDAKTGALLWKFATPYGIWSSPTMDPTGKNLYVNSGNPCNAGTGGGGCSGMALDLNPTTGAVIWSNHLADLTGDDDLPTTSTYNNGNVYLGSKNGIFYCLNASTGAIVWQYDTKKRGDSGIFSSPAYYNNRVYFGGGDGFLHALDATKGTLVWSFAMRSLNNVASPAQANGVMYMTSEDHNVYALDASTGKMLWAYRIGGTILSSPSISNGVLYVSGSDGYFYAFSLNGQ